MPGAQFVDEWNQRTVAERSLDLGRLGALDVFAQARDLNIDELETLLQHGMGTVIDMMSLVRDIQMILSHGDVSDDELSDASDFMRRVFYMTVIPDDAMRQRMSDGLCPPMLQPEVDNYREIPLPPRPDHRLGNGSPRQADACCAP